MRSVNLKSSMLIGLIVFALTGILSGCATDNGDAQSGAQDVIAINEPDLEQQQMLWKEAGYNLANYYLRKQSPNTIERAKALIDGISGVLEEGDVTDLVDGLTAFVDTYDFGDDQELAELGLSLVRVMSGLFEVNLQIPEEYDKAMLMARAFLQGAKEGAKRAMKLVPKATES